jgi:hypothetical protein
VPVLEPLAVVVAVLAKLGDAAAHAVPLRVKARGEVRNPERSDQDPVAGTEVAAVTSTCSSPDEHGNASRSGPVSPSNPSKPRSSGRRAKSAIKEAWPPRTVAVRSEAMSVLYSRVIHPPRPSDRRVGQAFAVL